MITIGKLATISGCKIQTIRYYEDIGIMPEAERSTGNQRLYNQSQVDRLTFIRHSRELGFSIDEIRELLSLNDTPESSCEHVTEVAKAHLDDVDLKIEKLKNIRGELERMIKSCENEKVRDCRIIESLANHKLCVSRH